MIVVGQDPERSVRRCRPNIAASPGAAADQQRRRGGIARGTIRTSLVWLSPVAICSHWRPASCPPRREALVGLLIEVTVLRRDRRPADAAARDSCANCRSPRCRRRPRVRAPATPPLVTVLTVSISAPVARSRMRSVKRSAPFVGRPGEQLAVGAHAQACEPEIGLALGLGRLVEDHPVRRRPRAASATSADIGRPSHRPTNRDSRRPSAARWRIVLLQPPLHLGEDRVDQAFVRRHRRLEIGVLFARDRRARRLVDLRIFRILQPDQGSSIPWPWRL
jgi:hypothetical protein